VAITLYILAKTVSDTDREKTGSPSCKTGSS
jgi:hypothetical protein